jgi:hypothetical protein
VADGTRDADARLERVLTCDPGIGVARHADAGYPAAIEIAESRGVRIPMRNAAEAFPETGRNAAEAFPETGRNAAEAVRETGRGSRARAH